MPKLPPNEIAKIGFNDSVRVDGHTFHVQTEVLVLDEVTIQTTILEAGLVKFAEHRPLPENVDGVEGFRSWVETHHRHYLRELNRKGAPWLAST